MEAKVKGSKGIAETGSREQTRNEFDQLGRTWPQLGTGTTLICLSQYGLKPTVKELEDKILVGEYKDAKTVIAVSLHTKDNMIAMVDSWRAGFRSEEVPVTEIKMESDKLKVGQTRFPMEKGRKRPITALSTDLAKTINGAIDWKDIPFIGAVGESVEGVPTVTLFIRVNINKNSSQIHSKDISTFVSAEPKPLAEYLAERRSMMKGSTLGGYYLDVYGSNGITGVVDLHAKMIEAMLGPSDAERESIRRIERKIVQHVANACIVHNAPGGVEPLEPEITSILEKKRSGYVQVAVPETIDHYLCFLEDAATKRWYLPYAVKKPGALYKGPKILAEEVGESIRFPLNAANSRYKGMIECSKGRESVIISVVDLWTPANKSELEKSGLGYRFIENKPEAIDRLCHNGKVHDPATISSLILYGEKVHGVSVSHEKNGAAIAGDEVVVVEKKTIRDDLHGKLQG